MERGNDNWRDPGTWKKEVYGTPTQTGDLQSAELRWCFGSQGAASRYLLPVANVTQEDRIYRPC